MLCPQDKLRLFRQQCNNYTTYTCAFTGKEKKNKNKKNSQSEENRVERRSERESKKKKWKLGGRVGLRMSVWSLRLCMC